MTQSTKAPAARAIHNPEPNTKLDKRGREVLDTEPARTSVRRQKMISLTDQMRQTVLAMRHEAAQAEDDSANDEIDFKIEDDEPRSPYELFVETPEYEMMLEDISAFAKNTKAEKPTPPAKPTEAKSPPTPKAAPEAESGKN